MTTSPIKNLIFDLGGVILDLSVDQTLQSFSRLAGLSPKEVRQIFVSAPGFNDYETGGMSDGDFRDFIRDIYRVNVADDAIDESWNAMLQGFPLRKLELLTTLRKRYRILLLSNTNGIHLRHINDVMLPAVVDQPLESFFDRAYYSHRMGMRKPDTNIFERVLTENRLIPEQTLFLDDNMDNVMGAAKVGIRTVHVNTPDYILDYFDATGNQA